MEPLRGSSPSWFHEAHKLRRDLRAPPRHFLADEMILLQMAAFRISHGKRLIPATAAYCRHCFQIQILSKPVLVDLREISFAVTGMARLCGWVFSNSGQCRGVL